MLDGLGYVMVQVAVVALLAALFGGILGWIVGRAGRTSPAPVAMSAPGPVESTAERGSEVLRAHDPGGPVPPGEPPVAVPLSPSLQESPGSLIEAVPPAEPVLSAEPAPPPVTLAGPPAPEPSAPPVAAAPEVAESEVVADLKEQLERTEREFDRLETGAVNAWDRTVPQLEGEVVDLREERDSLAAELRETAQALDVAGAEVDRLRAAVAERDQQQAAAREGSSEE
ncbi:MAG: hypothetical protein ACK5LS_02920 [Propioniciclava sp.]